MIGDVGLNEKCYSSCETPVLHCAHPGLLIDLKESVLERFKKVGNKDTLLNEVELLDLIKPKFVSSFENVCLSHWNMNKISTNYSIPD